MIFAQLGRVVEHGGRSFPCSALVCLKKGVLAMTNDVYAAKMSADELHVSPSERRRRKRSRQRNSNSQTEEEVATENRNHHGCSLCSNKLRQIEEKLDKVLLLLPEFEQQKKKNIRTRRQFTKVSSFQDKEFIKAHIKNLRKGAKLGVADDFLKVADEVRKVLQPALKKARQGTEASFLQCRKTELIIDGKIYHGPERNVSRFTVDS